MLAADWWKVNSRTRSPTETASSTIAVMIRGVETSTSTPQASSNIHSFFGLFTRATTRGTPNSVFASNETTRFTLSSPVAATTTSHRSSWAPAREEISQASASDHSASLTEDTFIAAGSLSIRVTW